MSADHLVLLVAAGIGAGLAGSVAGLASLVSYPALLAIGLTPLTANVTNTMALVFSGAGSVLGSRPELRGQRALLRRLAVAAAAGGLAGSIVLLATPKDAFQLVVPWLIGLGSFAILMRPGSRVVLALSSRAPGRALPVAVFAIALYGGYFGAAAGVIMLALMLAATRDTVARSTAVKNVLMGLANALAALVFAFFGPVHWLAVAPLGLGFLIGARIGPILVRRAPADVLRLLIALAGIGLAVHLGIDAYA